MTTTSPIPSTVLAISNDVMFTTPAPVPSFEVALERLEHLKNAIIHPANHESCNCIAFMTYVDSACSQVRSAQRQQYDESLARVNAMREQSMKSHLDFMAERALANQLRADNMALRAQLAILERETNTVKAKSQITTSHLRYTGTALSATRGPYSETSRRNNVEWAHSVVGTARLRVQTLRDLEADQSRKLEGCRRALMDVHERAMIAQVEHERVSSEQAAELAATNTRLQETTSTLYASEQMNESLISAIQDVENMCLS